MSLPSLFFGDRSNLVKFWQIWSKMVKFGQIRTIWLALVVFRPKWPLKGPFWPAPGPNLAMSAKLGQNWVNLAQKWAKFGELGSSFARKSHPLGQFRDSRESRNWPRGWDFRARTSRFFDFGDFRGRKSSKTFAHSNFGWSIFGGPGQNGTGRLMRAVVFKIGFWPKKLGSQTLTVGRAPNLNLFSPFILF